MALDTNISMLLEFYRAMLTEKQRSIVEYYYNDDLSLGEIAKNEGITRQGVLDTVKRTREQLLELEEKLGLKKKFEQVQQIALAARNIMRIAEHSGGSRDISQIAGFIADTAENLYD